MRSLFAFIARKMYPSRYKVLQEQLAAVYATLTPHELNGAYRMLEEILILGEDRRFYRHIGFDIRAICRAVVSKILFNRNEGASTIEQQLVRVSLNEYERTLKRKVREILLATTLRDIIPRKNIPLVYLVVAYYGTGMEGLHQALARFNIIDGSGMTPAQAIEIIARIKFPESSVPNARKSFLLEKRKRRLTDLFNRHQSRT